MNEKKRKKYGKKGQPKREEWEHPVLSPEPLRYGVNLRFGAWESVIGA